MTDITIRLWDVLAVIGIIATAALVAFIVWFVRYAAHEIRDHNNKGVRLL